MKSAAKGPTLISPPKVRKRFRFRSVRSQPRVLIYEPSELPDVAAKLIIRDMETAIHERGGCTLALAGGTSWDSVYRRMTLPWLAERIAWNRVTILFDDDCVIGERLDVVLLGVGLNRRKIPIIEAAAVAYVLAAGSQKSATVARALEGPWIPDELPIQRADRATWLLDTHAARRLRATWHRE
jgi:6-phosphogluconolactonase/glucosamine-6-phosphate isomerase/deaminase